MTPSPEVLAFDFIHGAGHGWLEVPVQLLYRLGIAAQVSRFSYLSRDTHTAYLEEDSDAPRFLEALTKAGRPFTVREGAECFGTCFVRRLSPYPQPRALSLSES